MFFRSDAFWMKRAINLARKGSGKVLGNPMVGCVIVKKGRVLAEGFHRKFGGNHAEIEALLKHGISGSGLKRAQHPQHPGAFNTGAFNGATMYVNLEPCAHFGKTPPCVPEIIRSGIKRVVIGMKDPNNLVFGKGIRILKKNGIYVEVGCLKKECMDLNISFITNMKKRRPYIAIKAAMSLDGKIATKTGESKWITSEKSRKYAKKLRAKYDAILVGKNTVLRDDPGLKAFNKAGREPIRIILDSMLATSPSAKVYRNRNVILVTTNRTQKSKIKKFAKKAIPLKIFPSKIRLAPLLQWLYRKKGISSIFVEGGSEVIGSFFDEKFVDKVYFFIAPKIIGGKDAKPAVSGYGVKDIAKSLYLTNIAITKIGPDLLYAGDV